jgi:thiamine-phosphate pyrophosphorylase
MGAPSAYDGVHVLADDDPRWPIGPVEQARAACEGGASVVQLRAKHATDSRVLVWARAIRAVTRANAVRFVVNDRFDLALLAEADAVHLGQDDLPVSAISGRVRDRLAIGLSSHDPDQARAAASERPAYVAYGPVFGTTSKDSPYGPRTPAALAQAVRIVSPLPCVAIGGVTLDNVGLVADAGASGVAVISAVANADEPVAAVRALVAHFQRTRRTE